MIEKNLSSLTDVSEPVSAVSNNLSTLADVSGSVAGTAGNLVPMHLEDLTTLPLTTIPQRLFTMSKNYLSDLGEQVAAQSVGQFVIHKLEDSIWAVEKSIEWAAPSEPKKAVKPRADENEMNGSQKKESVPVPEGRTSRPLPWIFFIPVLVMWRGTRLAYETASSLLGKPPVHPEDVVVFLRNRRRGLRALRIRGKRTMKTLVGSPTIISKMTSFAHPVIVVLNKMLGLVGLAPRKESKRDLEVSTRPLLAGEEKNDADESVLEKLNRLSQDPDNIEDDPDFEPNSSVSSEESSSSSGDADASEEEKEVSTSVTITEITDADADEALSRPPPRTSSFIGEVIEEEDEETEVTDLDSPSSQERKPADEDAVSEGVSEDGEFASISSARSSEIFTDTCDSQNSSMQKISTVFKKSLISQNSF